MEEEPAPPPSRKIIEEVCHSLMELQESQGVTPTKVYKYVQAKYGESGRLTKGRLTATMERGVKAGYLVMNDGKYNLNITTARGHCGCKSSKRKKRKRRGCSNKPGFLKRLMKMMFGKKKCKKRKKKSHCHHGSRKPRRPRRPRKARRCKPKKKRRPRC